MFSRLVFGIWLVGFVSLIAGYWIPWCIVIEKQINTTAPLARALSQEHCPVVPYVYSVGIGVSGIMGIYYFRKQYLGINAGIWGLRISTVSWIAIYVYMVICRNTYIQDREHTIWGTYIISLICTNSMIVWCAPTVNSYWLLPTSENSTATAPAETSVAVEND